MNKLHHTLTCNAVYIEKVHGHMYVHNERTIRYIGGARKINSRQKTFPPMYKSAVNFC